MSPPRRGVCHQCGRSFDLRPVGSASGGASSSDEARNVLAEPPGLVCRHCGSEFVELLEPKRTRSREARAETEPHSGPEYDDDDEYEDYGDDQDAEDDEYGPGQSGRDGWYGRGDRDHRGPDPYHHLHPIGDGLVVHSFPGGILFRGGPLPLTMDIASATVSGEDNRGDDNNHPRGPSPQHLSFIDMIRFVINPGSFPPEHPIWRTVGFRGNPADYVFSEDAFQAALSSLMDQTGMRTVGLSEEQLDDLERVVWGVEEDERWAGKGKAQEEMEKDRNRKHEGKNQADTSVPTILPESSSASPACAICQEPYKKGEETIVLACKHQFHADCICPWLAKVASCPICRHDPLKRT